MSFHVLVSFVILLKHSRVMVDVLCPQVSPSDWVPVLSHGVLIQAKHVPILALRVPIIGHRAPILALRVPTVGRRAPVQAPSLSLVVD